MTTGLLAQLGAILETADPHEKARRIRSVVAAHRDAPIPLGPAPDRWPSPAQRDKPPLRAPGDMPKRGLGSLAGRTALLHAVCHIELNAMDLAVDMAGRFGPTLAADDQNEFIADWLGVADDEARHFCLLADRLTDMGAAYGDLPAHSGLWDAATRTSGSVLARLAIAPMVLEARGLDVTPAMSARLRRNGDTQSADALDLIYREEIGHVAAGTKWFRHLANAQGLEPDAAFADLVATFFPGGLKAPFNHDARTASDFPRDWYEGLVHPAPDGRI